MTRIDRLYMDNLSEFIFDDKRVVTFKFLSCTLGVHVNIAKQMLYQFYQTSNKTKRDATKMIYATYYVSGTAPQGVIMDPSYTEEQEFDSIVPDGYIVALCQEHELENIKQRYTKIHSVHIYALSAFPLDNIDILKKALKDPIYKERNPVDFGSLSCKTALEIREHRHEDSATLIVETPKSQPIINSKKDGEKSEPVSSTFFKASNTEKQNSTNGSADKKSQSAAPNKKSANQSDNRLKNMFAKASSKPPKEKQKIESEEVLTTSIKDVTVEPKQQHSKGKGNAKNTKPVESKGNSKGDQSRKRKRIKDVLSSSEEEKDSDDEEEFGLPESPIPQKRNLIDSDSEEEVPEIAKKSKSEDVMEEKFGRRKVSKTISKTFMDKDGFLVTSKEQIMVSEPETSDNEETLLPKKDSSETSKYLQNGNKDSHNKGSDSKTLDTKSQKNVVPAVPPTKSKQSTLMSFFQKK